MAKGSCNCGAVQFEIDTAPTDIFICHCSICRRFTGSGGIAVVLVENAQFRWLAGGDRVAVWQKPGADWEAWFCRTCGCAVPGKNDPEKMFVPVGTLTNGADQLRVAHHVWVGSKAPWEVIGDSGTRHLQGYQAHHEKPAHDD